MRSNVLWGGLVTVLLVSCTARMPFDAVVSQAINGRIVVTVLNGVSPTAGVNVQVASPNGSTQTLASTNSALTPGQAVFSEPTTGIYKVSIANQPSQAPNITPVKLTTGSPSAALSLQIGYGYLSITAADGKGFTYDETQTYHTYTITYINSTNQQEDATVLHNPGTTTLPPGWAVDLNPTTLQSGQSTQLIVQTAAMTVFGNVTITVTGISNSTPINVAPLVLTQYWSPEIDVDYSENCTANNGYGAYYAYVNFLCEKCTNSAETVVETFNMAGNSCSSGVAYSNTQTLTDSLTVPDGNGVAMVSGNSCIGSTVTMTSIFNGQNYIFTIPLNGCYYSSNSPVTIVPGML
jgi:hypothetical protein